jgi:hypothetical protein
MKTDQMLDDRRYVVAGGLLRQDGAVLRKTTG